MITTHDFFPKRSGNVGDIEWRHFQKEAMLTGWKRNQLTSCESIQKFMMKMGLTLEVLE